MLFSFRVVCMGDFSTWGLDISIFGSFVVARTVVLARTRFLDGVALKLS